MKRRDVMIGALLLGAGVGIGFTLGAQAQHSTQVMMQKTTASALLAVHAGSVPQVEARRGSDKRWIEVWRDGELAAEWQKKDGTV